MYACDDDRVYHSRATTKGIVGEGVGNWQMEQESDKEEKKRERRGRQRRITVGTLEDTDAPTRRITIYWVDILGMQQADSTLRRNERGSKERYSCESARVYSSVCTIYYSLTLFSLSLLVCIYTQTTGEQYRILEEHLLYAAAVVATAFRDRCVGPLTLTLTLSEKEREKKGKEGGKEVKEAEGDRPCARVCNTGAS